MDWLIERYQVRTDNDSGIVNDPNDWSREISNPRYILSAAAFATYTGTAPACAPSPGRSCVRRRPIPPCDRRSTTGSGHVRGPVEPLGTVLPQSISLVRYAVVIGAR